MGMDIIFTEFQKVPYLDCSAIGDRTVNLMPLWDGAQWSLWLPTHEKLFEMHPVEAVVSDYVAREPALPSDLWIPFVDLMWQRASWPEICRHITAICDDFHNMATSVAKIRHFFDTRTMLRHGNASSFVATEVEYILTLCRAAFDLLQEAISTIWNKRVRLLDDQAESRRKRRHLPETFSKTVLKHKRGLKTQEELESEYGLPSIVADQYIKNASFFANLRDTRDNIIHRGHSSPGIFTTERGFCVNPDAKAFRGFDWKEEHRYNKNIVSLLPWLARTITQTIFACNNITAALASAISFPPEIAPGYRIFVRGYNNQALFDLVSVDRGGSPWWNDTASGTTTKTEPHIPALGDIEVAAYYRYLDRLQHNEAGTALDDWVHAQHKLQNRGLV